MNKGKLKDFGGIVLEDPNNLSVAKIMITGDLAPIKPISDYIKRKNELPIDKDLRNLIINADFSIANLEAPLTDKPKPIMKTGPVLHAPPLAALSIRKAGFDAVSCANNHILDCGESAVLETMEHCRNTNLKCYGCGKNVDEALSPMIVELNEIRIGFLAFAESEFGLATYDTPGAAPLYDPSVCLRIYKLKQNVDVVLVSIHAGNEFYHLPRPGLVKLCRTMIESGADAIIGHHPHFFGGLEVWKKKPIFYSVGNFLFPSKKNKPKGWYIGLMLELTVDKSGVISFELYPTIQRRDTRNVSKTPDELRTQILSDVSKLSAIISDINLLEYKWLEYSRENIANILSNLGYPIRTKTIHRLFKLAMYNQLFRRLFFPPDYLLRILNHMRCESHRELYITILEQMAEHNLKKTDIFKNYL